MSGNTEIDCSYTKINLKGTKRNKMPRKSKKRGGYSTYSGISHHKVCIIVSVDENDNHYMKVAGLGPKSFEKYKKFTPIHKDSTLLISNSKPSIKQFANRLKISNDIIKTVPEGEEKKHTKENGNNIQSLNEFAKCISEITYKYHGVSIRHLNGYLAFNSLKKMIAYRNIRNSMVNGFKKLLNSFKPIRIKDISNLLLPVDLKEAYWEFNYGIYSH